MSTERQDGRHALELAAVLGVLMIAWGMAKGQEVGDEGEHTQGGLTVASVDSNVSGWATDNRIKLSGSPTAHAAILAPAYFQANRPLILAEFSVRMLDSISTRQALTNKCTCLHETQIGPIANTTPGVLAYMTGVSLGVNAGARLLYNHGHRKWARAVLIADIVLDGEAGVHNEILSGRR